MSKLSELEKLSRDMIKQNNLAELSDDDIKAWSLSMLQVTNGQNYSTDLIHAAHQRIRQLLPPTDEEQNQFHKMHYGDDEGILI